MIRTMNRADKYRFILRLLLFLLLYVMLQCLLIYYRHFQHIKWTGQQLDQYSTKQFVFVCRHGSVRFAVSTVRLFHFTVKSKVLQLVQKSEVLHLGQERRALR